MNPKPQYTKIGRDITVEDYLNGTTDEHDGHGYADWKDKIEEQVRLDGRITKAQLARFMNVESDKTIGSWLEADKQVQG